jgi:uncharacterized OB-fold protein
MSREPIAEGLFTWPDSDPTLIGGRCAECGRFTFPLREGCPYCGATAVARHLLGQRGTLWTWTSQGFLPKPPFVGQFTDPDNFQPWYVGLIEIPGQLRVESVLANCGPEDLEFGRPMRLAIVPFRRIEPDVEVVTFAFEPEPSSAVSTPGQPEARHD